MKELRWKECKLKNVRRKESCEESEEKGEPNEAAVSTEMLVTN
jgi:hypothetical protein